MNDTSPEIQKKMMERYMSLTGFERVQIGNSMFESAKKIAGYSLSKDLSEIEKKIQLFLRFYGHEFSEVEKIKIIARLSHGFNG